MPGRFGNLVCSPAEAAAPIPKGHQTTENETSPKPAATPAFAPTATRATGPERDADGSIFLHQTPGGATRTLASVLGEIVWLMSQSPRHKGFLIADLEWMVMTPALLNQYRLFYAKDRPLGVVLWAEVDDEVEARLAAGGARLRPQDWKSGNKLWIVDIIGPFGGHDEMIRDLKAKVHPDRELRYLAIAPGSGKSEVRVV